MVMQAVRVQLHERLWRETGHGFGPLRDLLLGQGPHLGSAGLLQGSAAIRLARAAALRAVCAQDAARGAQLLEGVEVRACRGILPVPGQACKRSV